MKRRKPHPEDISSETKVLDSLFGFYTRLPPAELVAVDSGALPAPYVAELALPFETFSALACKKIGFERTKNSVYALEAITVALDAGFYPPVWALDVLVGGIKKWHALNGIERLDATLGLRARGRNPFKKLLEEQRDEMLCRDVFQFNALFGVSPGKAAAIVSECLANTKRWDRSGWFLKPPSPRTIANRYGKTWKAVFDSPRAREALAQWTAEQRLTFVRRFPKAALPRHLQALL
jgi:hypothetical protein